MRHEPCIRRVPEPSIRHHEEILDERVATIISQANRGEAKGRFNNFLVEASVLEYDKPLRSSLLPRVLPGDYAKIVDQCARAIMDVVLGASTLPAEKVRPLVPPSQLNTFVMDELGALDYRPSAHGNLQIGGGRIDMAACGPLTPDNPPKLIELNLLGYCAMNCNQSTTTALTRMFPQLKTGFFTKDALEGTMNNLSRAGRSAVMVIENWKVQPPSDAVLLSKATNLPLDLHIIDRAGFEEQLSINGNKAYLGNGRGTVPIDVIYFRDMDRPEVLATHKDKLVKLLESGVRMYDSYTTMMFENKAWLSHLREGELVDRYAGDGKAILKKCVPATVNATFAASSAFRSENWVLKEVDTHGGKGVYVGDEMNSKLTDVKANPGQYCLQERIWLNRLQTDGNATPPGPAICDLAVFITYVYDRVSQRMVHFETTGYMTRATAGGFKVNIGQNGLVVPTFIAGRGKRDKGIRYHYDL